MRKYCPANPKGETRQPANASIFAQPSSETYRVGCPSLWMRVSKRRLGVYSLLLLVFLAFLIVSRKYIWLYATRKLAPAPASADLLRDPKSSQNPEILLAEANRLAWVFNWPKAQPLYVRVEELLREKGDTRDEVYARVGRIALSRKRCRGQMCRRCWARNWTFRSSRVTSLCGS